MFCTNCGKEVCDNAVICTQCGCYVNGSEIKKSKPKKSGKSKAVDLISIFSFAGYNFLSIILTIIAGGFSSRDYTTYYILRFVVALLFVSAMTIGFILSFKAEEKHSKVIAILLFIYAAPIFVSNMITMINVIGH